MTVPVATLQSFCVQALQSVGMSLRDAETTADALVMTDTMGVFTHGTKLLIGYLNRLRGGGYRATGVPRIERDGPAWAIVNGDSALGQVGGVFALQTAIAKARQVGVAYVGLKEAGHIGAAGYYSAIAAREGLISVVLGNDMPSVAAPGSRGAVMGSNPIAYGVPVGTGDPILLDMATAAVAGGKVYAAHQRGEPIPATWLIGSDGHPTTDGSLYPHQASLAPMAGHKGYGLGLLAELLSGALTGGAMMWQVGSWIFDEPNKPSRHNAAFIVIDVATVAPPDEFATRVRQTIEQIRSAPTAEGIDHVLLPGEREWNLRRQALETGIALPEDVKAKLKMVSQEYGVPANWL